MTARASAPIPARLSVALPLAVLLLAASGCGTGDGDTESVRLYAAVSLREPLTAAREQMEAVAGVPVIFNFGASNDLARQIVAARRADLFLSADTVQMDVVEKAGLVLPGSRRAFLSNRLVVVAPAGPEARPLASPEDLALPRFARLSMADPSGVPAGRYARAWLEGAGLWERLRDRVVPAIDARAALAAVESGAAQAGVVYGTDAALSRRVDVVWEVDPDEGPAITYAAAVLSNGGPEEGAGRLLEFLAGEGAAEIFGSYGFVIP